MKDKVIETIKKYELIQAKDKIVLGVSGGPDSITMLDILRQIREEFDFEIVVAHINHMIRKEAIQDEEYVKKYCEKNNIKCFVKRIDVIDIANNSFSISSLNTSVVAFKEMNLMMCFVIGAITIIVLIYIAYLTLKRKDLLR